MSHVDDGALHAYLDGALDEYPDAEARWVRAHLDHCSRCLGRLEEERVVRERAAEVLSAAEAPVVLPPIEELRRLARSGDTRPSVRARRRYRAGWAASVVLALGAGWLLRSSLPLAGTDGASASAMLASGPESAAPAGPPEGLADAQPGTPDAAADADGRAGGGAPARLQAAEPGASTGGALADATAAPSAQAAAGASAEPTAAMVAAVPSERSATGEARDRAAARADAGVEASGGTPAEAESRIAGGALPDAVVEDRELPPRELPPRELFAAADPAGARAAAPPPTDSVVLPPANGPRPGLPNGAAPASSIERMAARADAAGAGGSPVAPGSEAAESEPSPGVTGTESERRSEESPGQDPGRTPLELRASAGRPATGLGPVGVEAARDSGEPAPAQPGSYPGSLVVPGLEVVSIVWREEGVTPAGVRVLQRLDDERMLELIHLPEGVEPASVERPGPGVTQLVVPRENGWLVLRAPVDEAALTELLRRLEAAP